jgi:2'-5' RNA ligase
MRAFLAVPVGPPAHAALAAELAGLRRRIAGVRWVDPATIHITLHFFAELPQDRISVVVEGVGAAAAAVAPFPLRLGELGSFPSASHARVLGRGLVDASAPLEGLAALVQVAVSTCGFAVDPRPFRAHVTLGRPDPGFDARAWQNEVAASWAPAAFRAGSVILYESRGGRHLVRETIPLAGAGPSAP